MDNQRKSINPSTYKQVLDNMTTIIELSKTLSSMTGLPATVDELSKTVAQLKNAIITPPETGGVITTPEGAKVVGLHSNTANAEVNTAPNSYTQGFTLELKSTAAIGLSGRDGITKPFVFVLTFTQDIIEGETPVSEGKYAPMQLAFADMSSDIYVRSATNNVWGEWTSQDSEFVSPIIQSDTEPVNQPVGHYWCEPISEPVIEE